MGENGLIGDLILNLREQQSVYAELLALSLRKKDIIVKNQVDELRALTGEENAVVGRAQRLERERGVIRTDIAEVLGRRNPDDITAEFLAETLKGQPEAAVVRETFAGLKRLLGDVRVANDVNRQLIDNALEYIDFTTNVIRSSMGEESPFATYGRG